MSKWRKFEAWNDKVLGLVTSSTVLVTIPFVIVIIGFGIVGYCFWETWSAITPSPKFVFTDNGLEVFYRKFGNSIRLFGNVVAILAGTTALLSVYAAVQTYRVSLRSSNLANHGKQLEVFVSSADGFIAKQYRLHSRSVDKYRLYHFLFSDPVNGDFSPSPMYQEWQKRQVALMNSATKKLLSEERQGRFDEKSHYKDIGKNLKELGIEIQIRTRRAEMFKLEEEVYEFLNYMTLLFFTRAQASEMNLSIPKYCHI